ncbi:thioredoxin family protein [Fimbriimonas ginsengisoli]|uniref:Thioredoxin domain-containing protein n=1 Tax=Fimbriimonas ginsengisoli Gsoil 348 TaxID=661478 RepID=A0A068NZ32_FIMGI|nr:thioredoxin family protein [Fimbriimonas ginsengisoli]AIE87869.1 Thioredoxin domain-containing protein [Fimbriimonas ginsengisoli Gsoil 348]
MRRTWPLVAIAAIAAVAAAQTSGTSLLASFGKALNEAKSVRSTYTAQTVGSGAETYTIALKKPNLARIETPAGTIVADGKQVTTYTKEDNTYFKRPQTEKDVKEFLTSDELGLFAGFFNPKAYDAPRSRAIGQRQMNGTPLSVVEATAGKKTKTYFLSTSDNVARKSQIELNDPNNGKLTTILDTKSLELNADLPDSTFTFVPPADARELSLDEINNGRWYTDLDEALKVARASNKHVFIDFMATWCGPCKMLERECFGTAQFKAMGKSYVWCRIDVDQQPTIASRYHAEAIPLQVVLDKSGGTQDQLVGYGGPARFFEFLTKNAK